MPLMIDLVKGNETDFYLSRLKETVTKMTIKTPKGRFVGVKDSVRVTETSAYLNPDYTRINCDYFQGIISYDQFEETYSLFVWYENQCVIEIPFSIVRVVYTL